jgi:hypothetical protein
MNPVGRLIPVNLARREPDVIAGALVPIFDGQRVAAEDYGNSMEGIPVPRRDFPWREAQPSDERHAMLVERLVVHRRHPRAA